MKLYHTTDSANEIRREGFSDGDSTIPGKAGKPRRAFGLPIGQ